MQLRAFVRRAVPLSLTAFTVAVLAVLSTTDLNGDGNFTTVNWELDYMAPNPFGVGNNLVEMAE